MNNKLSYPTTKRLVTKADFSSVFEQPKRLGIKHLLILYKPSKNAARLGVIVGKKSVQKANDRNRVKRIIRESFRQNAITLKPLDIIVIARHSSGKISKKELRQGIDQLWKKLAV